jgi:N-acetyl-anhydromuramyl-L-alanine amidase AmpD
VAVYSREIPGRAPHEYEVIIVRIAQAKVMPSGSSVPKREEYPTNSQWGTLGWSIPKRDQAIAWAEMHGIILHSSDSTEQSGINQLTTGGVSAHYFVTKDGRIYQFVNDQDTAYHAGQTKGPYAGLNNNNTIGIEQEHFDPGGKGGKNGEAWSPAQVAATARLVASLKAKYGLSDDQIKGHSDIAPGRKQDPFNYPWQGFFSAVDNQSGAPAGATATTATGAPAAKGQATTDAGSYITGKATTFGYNDPNDPGVGAPKLGQLNTNNTDLVGVAVPQEALQRYVSAHPADWRKARVDVVGQNGQHVLVPIVDLGPRDTSDQRGVVADFTQGLTNLTGNTGDQTYQFKIIPNAGPDVMKDPQGFADEQAAIKAGINTGARFQPQVQAAKKPSYVLAPLDSATQAAGAKTAQDDIAAQKQVLSNYATQNPNKAGLYKQLAPPPPPTKGDDEDNQAYQERFKEYRESLKAYQDNLKNIVPGVSTGTVNNFLANLKSQLIGLMQQKDPSLTNDQAWSKAMTDPNALDVGADFWNKFVGSFQQLQPLLQQATGPSVEQSHLDSFLSQALPNGSDADKHALLTKLYAMPADQRGPAVASMIPNPQVGVPGQDPQQVVSALDRLSDPNYAKQQADQAAQAQSALRQRMTTDPRLVGTPAAFASENLATLPEMLAATSIPPLMAAQVGRQVRDQIQAQHPEYSEDELDQKSAYATLVQFVGQEAAGRLFSAGAGALIQGIKAPIKRAVAQALIQTGAGSAISGGTQALTNVVTGEPIGQGVGTAALAGAMQGGVMGAVHAGGEFFHPEASEAPAKTPGTLEPGTLGALLREPLPEAPTKAPLGQEPVVPPPVTGPKGGAVRGAEPETMATGGKEAAPVSPRPEAPVQPMPPFSEEAPPAQEEAVPPEANEAALNQQSAALYRQYQAEANLIQAKPDDIQKGAAEPDVQGAGAIPPVEPGILPSTEEPPPDPGMQRAAASGPRSSGAYASDPVFNRAVGIQIDGNIAATRHLFDSLGVSIAPQTTSDRAFRTGFDSSGRITLEYNPHLVAQDAATIQAQGGDFRNQIRASVQEELIHAAHLAELRDSWRKTDPAHPFDSFANKYHSDLLDQTQRVMADAERRGNKPLAQDIRQALRESIDVYDPQIGSKFPDAADQTLARVKTDPMLASSVANELVRQLVQIRSGNPITEHSWQGLLGTAKQWITRTLAGLRRLAGKVQTGYAGRMLRDAVISTETRLRDIQRMERGEIPPSVTSSQQFAGRAKLGARQPSAVAEKLRSGARWYSHVFKGGESAMLDNKETQPLALAMRRRPSLEQKFGQRAQITQLADAFNSVAPKDRPRVVKEFSDYVKAEQMKQPLPAIGADTRRLINAGKNSLEQLGQISKELNVHVRTSDGKIRPMQLIGRDYYPRMISADMRDIFNQRDGARAAEFNRIVNDQIVKGKVKSRDEFIDRFAQATTLDRTSNGHFGNLEKAREARLPLDFYDFSPEALLKYAERSNKRLAQVGAYGQKLSENGKDLFDRTIQEVQNNSKLPYRDKEGLITRIQQEQRAEYAEHEHSNLNKVSSLARSAASGAFLGNPITSMYNLISGAAQNLAFGGPGPFLRTAAEFATGKKMLDAMKEARERNILKSNLSEILHDYELVTDQGWATKGVQGFTSRMLKWGGQNLTEGINRAFGMQQGKHMLNQFARIYGQDNARARSIYAMIQRRGIYDLSGLAKEKGSGPLTDEFLRQFVMDIHGNYGPSQSASHLFDSPAGKVLAQFQKWGANTQRMATREFLMPLARAAKERRPADFAYQLSRNLGYIATAVGAGGAAQMLRNFLTGKDPQDPTVQEIWKRFSQGDGYRALQETLQRAWGAVILSGFTGTIGNYSDLANQLAGATPGARVKDPLHPPAWGIIQPFVSLLQGWNGENHFTAAPSPRVWDDFAQNILSAYRVGKPMVLNATNAAGLKFPLGQEYAAKNDLAFLRSRVKQYEDENSELRAARQIQGNRDISMSGRGEFDPIKDRIQGALLTGHPEEAQRAFADWLDRFAPGEQKARLASIRQSIQSSSPIKPGGSYKLDSELQFLRWAKQNLPEDEARKIFASAQTYAKTATETGLFDRNKTMQAISNLDFDKFVVTTPKATAKVTVVRPGQPSLADEIRKELAAKALRAQMAH